MEKIPNHLCPRCGRVDLNLCFASDADEKLGVWCENCNLRAYFDGDELISMKYS
jgi:transcription elongation factor Elf1